MKVLITGASGLLGRRIFDIISKSHETVGTYNKNNNGDFHFLDISDKNSVDLFFEKIKPGLVIHCAALVDADYCEENMQTAKKINIDGTKNVVQACKNSESKLVFISSDYIFKGDNPPYTEESIPDPVNYYGITKVEGEKLVRKHLSQFIIIRPPLMYGDDRDTKPSFITQVVNKLKDNESIFLDNKIIKYPTLTDDIVFAILRLIESDIRGIYNICSEEGITKYAWAKKIANMYGFSEKNIIEKNNMNDTNRPLDAKLDSSKIKKLGIEFTTIHEGLKKTFKKEYTKKYNFKIIRSDQVPLEDRGSYGGYAIRRLFTELLPKNAENIGFYETTIYPDNIVKNHYHNNLDEIFYFFTNGTLKIGQETVLVQPRDIVILPRGVPHELIANDKEIKLLAIKIPNIPDDKIIMEKEFIESGSYAKLQKIEIIRKEASKKGIGKLIDEINWINNLPKELKEHFPEIIRYDIDSPIVFSEMKHYPMNTLRRLIIDRIINEQEALKQLEIIFDFMFNKLYTLPIEEDTHNLVEDAYFNRAKNRLGEMSGLTPIFKKVLNTKKMIINGKEYEHILPILEKLESDENLKKVLQPHTISYIHGDLHLGNILVDKENPYDFILIDPRGRVYGGGIGGDYAYDLGKIWHSLNGLYDFIHENKFIIKNSIEEDVLKAEINISDEENRTVYKKILQGIPQLLQKYEKIRNDPYWYERTLFSEIIHFCSMLPFHREGDNFEKKPIALYLRSVILLSEFMDGWKNVAEK